VFIVAQCPVNMKVLALKIGALQLSPQNKNVSFLKVVYNSDKISVIYLYHIPKQNYWKTSRK
jgi:uncharacterized membrane protein